MLCMPEDPAAKRRGCGSALGEDLPSSALVGLVVQHLPVQRVAKALNLSWRNANRAVLTEGPQFLIDDSSRLTVYQ